jgi:hypothetical protein
MTHRTTVGHVHLSARWVRIALSPSSPLRFRTAGFPQYGSKAGFSDEAFPAMHGHRSAQFAPVVRAHRGRRVPSLKVEALDSIKHRHSSGSTALPQGPSLRSGLFCPGPSSLNRPHPPHSSAREDFAALRFIPHAFAVPFGLGDWRVDPCFRCSILPDMPPSTTPGSSSETFAQPISRTLAFAPLARARHSQRPHHPIQMGPPISGLHWFALAAACQVVSLLVGSDRGFPQPQRRLHPGFRRIGHPHRRRTSLRWQLGTVHRRDFHPLDRQLASLHAKAGGIQLPKGRQ